MQRLGAGAHLLGRHLAVADLPEYHMDRRPDILRMYRDTQPDIVIHLAARVGGIGFNQAAPANTST
mgnify:CR=1 FL=1